MPPAVYKLDQFELGFITVNGHRFIIRQDTSDIKSIKEVIIRNGYQKKGFQICAGEKWLDFGACIGAFTVLAASREARVIAFEPDPLSFALLEQNISQNGYRCELRNEAVVASDNEAGLLYVNAKNRNFWRNSLVKQWRGGYSIPIKQSNFRRFLEPDICIKMDVEGSEFEILEALEPNDKIKKLVFEWSFDINGDLRYFRTIINKLRTMFLSVRFNGEPKLNTLDTWPANWFPPCLTIFCS